MVCIWDELHKWSAYGGEMVSFMDAFLRGLAMLMSVRFKKASWALRSEDNAQKCTAEGQEYTHSTTQRVMQPPTRIRRTWAHKMG